MCPEAEIFASEDEVELKEVTIGIPHFGKKIGEIGPEISLTFRERQIYSLWMGGLNRKEICKTLKITGKNLRTRLHDINQKMFPKTNPPE